MDLEKKLGPRDVFFYLLSMVALYMGAINFGVLLFQYINLSFPDVLEYYPGIRSLGPLRWALATVTIVFPVYIWTQWFLERDFIRFPEKRALRTRKWLIHFTLFVAAVVIIGDLISVLFNFLQGELTLRFFLKTFSVFLIAFCVFGYYVWNLKRDDNLKVMAWMKNLARGVMALAAVIILSGFFVAGSPSAERLRRFDERKVSDLQNIQWQIIEFWRNKEKLPASLNDLKDSISGYAPPFSPQDKSAYGYKVLGELHFNLCANFNTEVLTSDLYRKNAPALPLMEAEQAFENWVHTKGKVCFDRVIDSSRYKPYNKKD